MCPLFETLIVKLKQHERYGQFLRPPELRLRFQKEFNFWSFTTIFNILPAYLSQYWSTPI